MSILQAFRRHAVKFLVFVAVASASVYGPSAFADSWPDEPIHFVVSFNPGAGPDVVARLISDKLQAELGQPIIVDNRPGAGGRIAIGQVKRAKPDGYTFLIATHRFAHNPGLYQDAGYDPIADFAPVINMLSGKHLLVVNKDLGVSTLAELTALLKAHPGHYNYASGGIGSVGNLAGELYKLQAGVDAVHIPFKSPADAIKSVISGETQFAFLTSAQSFPNVKSGKLIALAVNGDQRTELFPDLPTIKEAGLPEFNLVSWEGIVAPAGTPTAIIDKMNHAITQALKDPKIVQSLDGLGMTVTTGSPQAFGEFLKKETAEWTQVIHDAGIHVG